MKRLTSLSQHVIQFCRVLRNDQFNIGPQEEREALQALQSIDWGNIAEFKQALKTTLCKSLQQTLLFEDLYTHYWKELNRAVDSKTKEVAEEKPQPRKEVPSIEVIKDWLYGEKKEQQETELAKASADEITGGVDLSTFSNEQFKEWKAVIQQLQKFVARLPNRRTIPTDKTAKVDFRRTMAKNLSYGGEMLKLSYKKKKENKTQIVLLLDVSKSMELYSRFMIQMMFALQNSNLNIQTFVFSTQLYSITKKLKSTDIRKSLDSLSAYVEQWSSGTQIGHCFQQFITKYGERALTKKTFVFIVSDGWDSGDIDQLQQSMQNLKKRANKIIWINPLAKSRDYQPEVLGMKTALPYVDYLVPAINAKDLKQQLGKMR